MTPIEFQEALNRTKLGTSLGRAFQLQYRPDRYIVWIVSVQPKDGPDGTPNLDSKTWPNYYGETPSKALRKAATKEGLL